VCKNVSGPCPSVVTLVTQVVPYLGTATPVVEVVEVARIDGFLGRVVCRFVVRVAVLG